jgi:hypothetical protein
MAVFDIEKIMWHRPPPTEAMRDKKVRSYRAKPRRLSAEPTKSRVTKLAYPIVLSRVARCHSFQARCPDLPLKRNGPVAS